MFKVYIPFLYAIFVALGFSVGVKIDPKLAVRVMELGVNPAVQFSHNGIDIIPLLASKLRDDLFLYFLPSLKQLGKFSIFRMIRNLFSNLYFRT